MRLAACSLLPILLVVLAALLPGGDAATVPAAGKRRGLGRRQIAEKLAAFGGPAEEPETPAPVVMRARPKKKTTTKRRKTTSKRKKTTSKKVQPPAVLPTQRPAPPPPPPANGAQSLRSWLTQATFERIFPYHKASAVYTGDGAPFYDLESFLSAVDWLEAHPDARLHGFGTSATDHLTNVLEVAAFFASAIQETGDPSLTVPYPWAWPAADARTGPEFNTLGAGGLLCIVEGLAASMTPLDKVGDPPPLTGILNAKIALNANEKYLMGFQQTALASSVLSLTNGNQTSFGLGQGTGGGVVFEPGLVGVSDDGTLYGDEPRAEQDKVKPSALASRGWSNNRATACHGMYCQYGGRGVQQLSYNFNYAPCSLELFGDYRLVRYPNLIITVDRKSFMGQPGTFGFPGPNPGGNNQIPANIASTTPPARQMAWITSLWFYMRATSSRSITCHQAMMDPFRYGITAANVVVNSQSGCESNSWASAKNAYYRRVCGILGVDAGVIERTIVCPAAIQ